MAARWIEAITGSFEEKRSYRRFKRRKAQLPSNYLAAFEAIERYLTYYGAVTKGRVILTMLDDLIDLFEQAAADGTSIRALVGADPIAFVEDFLRNYTEGQWIEKERKRFVKAIDDAADGK